MDAELIKVNNKVDWSIALIKYFNYD